MPGREPGPLCEDEDEGRWVLYCWCEGGKERFLASWRVTIRSPGLTEEVGPASPGLEEVDVGIVPSLATSVEVDAWALVFGVIVDVEEERDSFEEGVPRWVSLSSVSHEEQVSKLRRVINRRIYEGNETR